MKRSKYSGFSLLELLVVSTLISVMMVFMGPSLGAFIERQKVLAQTNELRSALAFARNASVSLITNVIICPVDKRGKCSRDWNQPLTVYADNNGNRRLGPDDDILKVLPKSLPAHHRHYNNHRIQFDPMGRAGFQAGSLSLCATVDSYQGGSALIISRMGRTRRGTDRNQDGLPETANGSNIPCKKPSDS